MKDIEYYKRLNIFDDNQLKQIEYGLSTKINVEIYADIKYNWHQMYYLRKCLEEKLDEKYILNESYSYELILEIRKLLRDNRYEEQKFNKDNIFESKIREKSLYSKKELETKINLLILES